MPKLTKDARWWIATYEEGVEAQRVCLHDSLEDQRRFMERMRPDVATGKVRVIEPKSPEPQTFGSTLWMESSQVDAMAECFT